ncbi:MAG: hypothetical protein ACTSQI_12215 [Candidatus Helarchaeota archaeon]
MVKRNLTRSYQFLMWGGGLFAIVVGLALLLLVSLLLGEMIDTLYPYITSTTLLILKVIGWIYLIPGILTFICGFWAGFLARVDFDSPKNKPISKKKIKVIRTIVIITSVGLLLAFPIGTFIGLTLLREAWMLEADNSSEKI